MSLIQFIYIFFLLSTIMCKMCLGWSYSFVESGQKSMEFENVLFADSYFTLQVECIGRETHVLKSTWHLVHFQCENSLKEDGLKCHTLDAKQQDWERISLQSSSSVSKCSEKGIIPLKDFSGQPYKEIILRNGTCEEIALNSTLNLQEKVEDRITSTWAGGTYKLFLTFKFEDSQNVSVRGTLNLVGKHGHLTQFLYWKYVISCLMSVLYLLLSSMWLGIWACAKEHTSRIHVALGLVCVLACLSNILMAIDLSVFKSSGRPSHFVFTLGTLMFIFYCLFVNVIFTAAGTGIHIIRPTLTRRQWTVILSLCGIIMLFQIIQMFLPRGRTGGPKDNSIFRLEAPFKVQNYLLMTEAVIEHILSSVCLYFCSTTFIYLYLRRHSSLGKFIAFSFFASSSVVIFLASFISTLAMITDKFSTCINSELSTSDWFTVDLFPQIKLLISLAAAMFLWRPVDEFRSYGFQALNSIDDAQVHYSNSGPPDDNCEIIINKFPSEADY